MIWSRQSSLRICRISSSDRALSGFALRCFAQSQPDLLTLLNESGLTPEEFLARFTELAARESSNRRKKRSEIANSGGA
jgi:hypothetical protein